MSLKKTWPSINISHKDKEIIDAIKRADGLLKSCLSRDIMLIAAAIAIKNGVICLPQTENLDVNIIHQDTLNKFELKEYRQYLLLFYYLTAGDKKLQNMSNTKAIVDNFVKIAHTGLGIMKMEYLESRSGSENYFENYQDTMCQIFEK